MGNIMSFFFPQPAPASIEQVEEAAQEGVTTEEVGEETVAVVAEDAVSVEATKTVELVVNKEIEATEVLPEEENDEGFEVVEENSLIEVNNLHQETNSEAHPEILSPKEKSPRPAEDDVEETQEESQTEIECIGSIENNNVNLLREEASTVKIPEPVKTPEPTKASTPEPPRAITPEPLKAPTPEPPRHITPEPVKAPTPEPPRAITPDTVKAPTHEPPRAITPEPVKVSSPEPPTVEPVLTTEPPKVPIPEVAEAPTPEPEEASSKDISSDVEVIEFSAEDDKKMAEEVSGGVSGLRDILDNLEPHTAITPEPVKDLTPEPPRALTPEPVKAPTHEPPRAITPEPVKAPTIEPPRALTPEPVKASTPEPPTAEPVLMPEPPKTTIPEVAEAPTPKPEEASSKDICSDVEVIEFSAEDDKKMAEEVSGGASGLRDILDTK